MRAHADDEAVIERRGAAGVVVLNRPKALNALTLTMVRLIAAALDGWERDPTVTRVVIRAAGERAFCAGGDIRHLYELGRAGAHAEQLIFWREEYQLNRRIRLYPKPVVALIDGIVMGGGVGVSINASHRVAGEGFSFAMPEVGIGFFPDVGATYILPRLAHRAGVYLGLTGARADAGDALALGLAEAFVPRSATAALAQALEAEGDVDATLGQFSAPPPASALMAEAATLDAAFAPATVDAILNALDARQAGGSAFAAAAGAAIRSKSPTSLAIALRQMALGRAASFDEALRIEFRIVSRVCRGRDFYEGVRALIIEKDNKPVWSAPPSGAEVDAYFAPLGADELTFANAAA